MLSDPGHTDEELFRLVQSGNENAFAALYNRYWDRLLARAVLQLVSTQDAEDVLHDVFVGLWNRKDKIVLRYSFHTYIASILKYEVINRLAERKKKNAAAIGEGLQEAMPDNSLFEQLKFQELQQRLERTVQQLPEKCQLVFRLSRDEGLKVGEIAHALQISPKTVQNHINHALHVLRSALNNFLFLIF